MGLEPPRSARQRKADTLAKLGAAQADLWVATASVADDRQAAPHLVPLTSAWLDQRVVIAVEATSLTARNLLEHGRARLGLGPTRDVVMIDALLDEVVELKGNDDDDGVVPAPDDGPDHLALRYAAQAGWDPRSGGADFVLLALRPERIQAWREENELAGRTLMRDGDWLD